MPGSAIGGGGLLAAGGFGRGLLHAVRRHRAERIAAPERRRWNAEARKRLRQQEAIGELQEIRDDAQRQCDAARRLGAPAAELREYRSALDEAEDALREARERFWGRARPDHPARHDAAVAHARAHLLGMLRG